MNDLSFIYIMQLAFGYWNSHPLFILTRLNIFDVLNENPMRLEELGERVGFVSYSLSSILNAGVALRLLVKENNIYRNSSIADKFLFSGSPNSLVNWVKVMERWTRPWTYLGEVVVKGHQIEFESKRLGEDTAYLSEFILGMHEFALGSLDEYKANVGIKGAKYALDIGGGAGTYSIALCETNADLRVKLLDLEHVLPIATKIITEYGLQNRISVGVADYTKDPFGEGEADVILLSNVLHQESPSMVRSILERVHEALKLDGELIIQGYFLDENRTSPLFATLHNLSAIVLWNKGQSYTIGDMKIFLNDVDLTFETSFKISNTGFSVIKARKARIYSADLQVLPNPE